MKHYEFKVVLEPDQEKGGYVIFCPSLPGCYSQGDTLEQAMDNIREAIILCLEDMQDQNLPVPDPSLSLVGTVGVDLPDQAAR